MGMRAPVTSNGHVSSAIDWLDLKARIVAALGPDAIHREFAALGVLFDDNAPNGKGKAACHAMDRPDLNASAFVDCVHGVYHSKGEKVETLNLFDFALKYGAAKFADWLTTVKHYARLCGIDVEVRKDSKGRIVEATYDYTDEAGEVLYQVVRYRLPSGKKDFRQRRPDGKGGWIYDLEGTRRVLYELPRLLDRHDCTVVIVEGEKDADRLNELFVVGNMAAVATTSAQGANDTGRWEIYAKFSEGRHCVVIPDCDPAGMRHARGICGFLNGVASSVKLIELPDVGPKGDVSDWLDQGHELDELWQLVVAAAVWDPAANPPVETKPEDSLIVWARQLTKRDIEWLWPNRIAIGFIAIFAGCTGLGKSFVLLDLIARLTTRRPLPDLDVIREPIRALVISEDPQEHVLLPRLDELKADLGRVAFMRWSAMAAYTLDDIGQLELAYEQAERPILIVIDPPANFLGGKDEHKNAEVRSILMGLVEWLSSKSVACVLVTHTNKQVGKGIEAIYRIMGSVAWGSTARVAIGFARDPDNSGQCLMAGIKNNLGPLPNTLSYQIVRTEHLATVVWNGQVETTIDDAMNRTKKKSRGQCATEWLIERFTERREWESSELRRLAGEFGLSKNALWSDEVQGLPIQKKKRCTQDGKEFWLWVAKEGWPEKNIGNVGNVGNLDPQVECPY